MRESRHKDAGRAAVLSLLMLAAGVPAAGQQAAASPASPETSTVFVSRLKAEPIDYQVKLTWSDSPDLKGDLYCLPLPGGDFRAEPGQGRYHRQRENGNRIFRRHPAESKRMVLRRSHPGLRRKPVSAPRAVPQQDQRTRVTADFGARGAARGQGDRHQGCADRPGRHHPGFLFRVQPHTRPSAVLGAHAFHEARGPSESHEDDAPGSGNDQLYPWRSPWGGLLVRRTGLGDVQDRAGSPREGRKYVCLPDTAAGHGQSRPSGRLASVPPGHPAPFSGHRPRSSDGAGAFRDGRAGASHAASGVRCRAESHRLTHAAALRFRPEEASAPGAPLGCDADARAGSSRDSRRSSRGLFLAATWRLRNRSSWTT